MSPNLSYLLLDDPWGTAEHREEISEVLLEILLEDTSESVQPLGPKEMVLSNIMTVLLEMDLQETGEPSPLENPLGE